MSGVPRCPGATVIEVRANAILGNVTVRPAKLTQRLRASLEERGRASLEAGSEE